MKNNVASLKSESLSFAELLKLDDEPQSHVLGALVYRAVPLAYPLESIARVPLIQVSMSPLGEMRADGPAAAGYWETDADAVCEVWLSGLALTEGQCGDIRYRHDGETLFGAIELAETNAESDSASTPLQHTTEQAYRQIFGLLETLDYPFMLRAWNYMADINSHSHGLERYRQFNLGRQDAFVACGRELVGNVPAACALGADGGPLTISFLAARNLPLAIENPRQVSAYDYPQSYGPRSPTFSRASLARIGSDELLFVSGTASIVGHCTMHPGDVEEQTRETLINIEAVIQAANLQASRPLFSLGNLFYRVYVRHSADLAAARDVMARRIGPCLNAVFLQADVCRQDLLIEIEASAALPA